MTTTTSVNGGRPETSENARQATLIHNFHVALQQDIESAANMVSADFIAHVPGTGELAGEYWGADGLRTLRAKMSSQSAEKHDIRMAVLSVNGADGFARLVVTADRASDPGRIWTLQLSAHYKVKAGRISELWLIPENQREFDAYWQGKREDLDAAVILPPSAPDGEAAIETATSHETLERLTTLYDRFFSGDLAGVQEMFAEDVTVNIVGRAGISGQDRGWEGFLAFRKRLMDIAGTRYKLEIDAIAASEHDGWVKEYIRMDRAWDPMLRTTYVLMHFEFADGKLTQFDDFPLDTYEWEQFFTTPEASGAIC
jgi:ketosteroid isomerase-like protein